jgi:hypothetical protein
MEESALLLRRYDEGLDGYTYLEEEPPMHLENGGNGLRGVSSELHPVQHPEPRPPAVQDQVAGMPPEPSATRRNTRRGLARSATVDES